MPKVIITQAHFAFVDSKGRFTVAVRGDEVDVPTGPEFDRGEAGGAWAPESLPAPGPSEIPAAVATTNADGSPIFADNLEEVLRGNAKDVIAFGEANPALKEELLAREVGGENRKTVIAALQKLVVPVVGSISPDPIVAELALVLEGKEEDIVLYAEAHPDHLELLRTAEESGLNRATLIEGLSKIGV